MADASFFVLRWEGFTRATLRQLFCLLVSGVACLFQLLKERAHLPKAQVRLYSRDTYIQWWKLPACLLSSKEKVIQVQKWENETPVRIRLTHLDKRGTEMLSWAHRSVPYKGAYSIVLQPHPAASLPLSRSLNCFPCLVSYRHMLEGLLIGTNPWAERGRVGDYHHLGNAVAAVKESHPATSKLLSSCGSA